MGCQQLDQPCASFQRLARELESLRVDTVIDVGAAFGDYAVGLRNSGYSGAIVCIEPLPDAYEYLRGRLAGQEGVTIARRVALGECIGRATINVSENRVSSSLLPMLAAHSDEAPESRYVDTVDTEVTTLDKIFDEYAPKSLRAFVKIDTQGYEDRVLAGLGAMEKIVLGLQLELSLVKLYGGQTLWLPLIERLLRSNYFVWDLIPGFRSSSTGRLLQFDAVVFKSSGFSTIHVVAPPED